ncbi:MAG TPA: ABC transporter permease [Acidobacteriaceae bacterium]|nr:ABC transporter permease [Acidobacteriaceae bacterium]
MSRLASDLKLVLRQLRKTPAFTLTAVLMLAFGIGATTAIFSVVDGILLRPLPFPHPEQLVTLGDQVSGLDWGEHDPGPVTAPEVVTYQRDLHSFSSLGGYGYAEFSLSGVGQPAAIVAARMTPSVFTMLGVAPLMGRVFTEQEDTQHEQVVVLSYRTWISRFNGNPSILGMKILLDRKPYVVIGVMPGNFAFPLTNRKWEIALWVPMSFLPEELTPEEDTDWSFWMAGRLKPGVTAAQAEADANRVAQQIMRSYPPDATNFRIHPVVYPLQQITVLQTRPLLRLLFCAVAVVLLIACANFAGLLLVRAIRRQRETAVRLALGAPARRLLRQTVTESLALSVAGGLTGIGLAAFAIHGGRNLLPGDLPLTDEITLNWTVAGFALLLAALTGVFCGLAPGFAALRTNVNAQIKEGGRSGSGSAAHARLRSALVVLEIAVALVLLAASGLLLRSFRKMSEVNLGFAPDHVTTAFYSLPQKQYSTQAMIDMFNRDLLQRLQQIPGVQHAGLTSTLPTTGAGIQAFVVEGYVDPRGPDRTVAASIQVIGDYFRAIGTPLLRGRYFTDADDADSQLVVIVNHEFAEHYWPHQNPIGKRMRVGTLKAPTAWMTVVGEVADAKMGPPDRDAREQFYQPVAQLEKDSGSLAEPTDLNGNGNSIVVRSALPAEQMENAMRRVAGELDPQLPLSQVQTMDEVLAQSEGPRRFNTAVISSFALAAVLLAVLGIYSIIAFSVASRVQELAIRMALGSQRSHIMRLILTSGLKLAAAGTVLGLAGAVAASKLLRSFLFHVSPFDPAVMALAALAVFALALLASALPARRAASVDPLQALRGE